MTAPTSPYATPAKPPLTPQLKSAARSAGMLGFTMMSIGWGLFALAAGVGLFAAFFGFIVTLVARVDRDRDEGFDRLLELIERVNPGAWVVPLVVVGLVGIGVLVASPFLSAGILRRAGHPSPWGVTWAGAGIAIVASWFVSWIALLPVPLATQLFEPSGTGFVAGITGVVLSLALQLIIALVIGWLAWWWMAHALRPASAG